MADPSAQVMARMGRLIKEFTLAGETAAARGAMVAKQIHQSEIRSASGGDSVLSGVGKTGGRVGARFDVLPGGTAVVRATGPLHLLENPSKPHMIPGARRRGARKPLSTPYGPRWRVNHPGVRNPQKPWQKGFRKAIPAVSKVVQQRYGSAFGRAMVGR